MLRLAISLKKKKKNWLYYTVIENGFPNRKPTSFQCLKNPENYKQNLSNFYKNFKGVHDPQMVQIKSLLKIPTDKPQLAFIHTTYLNCRTIHFQINLKKKKKTTISKSQKYSFTT